MHWLYGDALISTWLYLHMFRHRGIGSFSRDFGVQSVAINRRQRQVNSLWKRFVIEDGEFRNVFDCQFQVWGVVVMSIGMLVLSCCVCKILCFTDSIFIVSFMWWMSINWATRFLVALFYGHHLTVYLNISFTDKDSCFACAIVLLCPSFLLSLLRLSIDDAFPIILARNLCVCDWNDFVFSVFIDGNFLHFAPNNLSRNFPSSSFNLNVSVIDV